LVFDDNTNNITNPKGTIKVLPPMWLKGDVVSWVGSAEGWVVDIGVSTGIGAGVSNMVCVCSH